MLHTPRTELDCGAHILEDVFADHPCWFGGSHAYFESPSFYHTYFLGAIAQPTAIEGHVVALPYRSIATAQHREVVVDGIVEVSRDGRNDWVTVGTFPVAYGVPSKFHFEDLENVDAQFVRLRTEPHRLWEFGGTHHMAGYLKSSTLVLEGDVPAHARGTSAASERAWALHDAAVAVPPS